MGVNENAVAIGNETIFSSPKGRKKALLGMDLLRLGLEKRKDAASAAETIIYYLEEYGQGGSNDQFKDKYYNNLFLIADVNEAYELYLAGKEYSLERVHSYDSISNAIPEENGRKRVRVSANFSSRENFIFTKLGRGAFRSKFTLNSLKGKSKKTDLMDFFRILRSHSTNWSHPREGSNRDVCMHAGPLSRGFQTVNSMVIEMIKGRSVIWSTFSSNPCISLYKPVFFSSEKVVGLKYDSGYWLRSEEIHRGYFNSSSVPFQELTKRLENFQTQIIDLTTSTRNMWFSGTDTLPNEDEKLVQMINEIDHNYLATIASFTRNPPGMFSSDLYSLWWKKKEGALRGAR